MTQVSNLKHYSLLKTGASLLLLICLAVAVGIPSQGVFGSPGNVYVYPVMAPRLSSKYGKRQHPVLKATRHHSGVDLAAPDGAPIRAIQSGRVVFADPHGGYGNLIVVEHTNGLTSHYGHCASIGVQLGEQVRSGQIIGTVGKTGRVTGPHLHFEIRKDGQPQNPEKYIEDIATRGSG